jgi:hypothetical protein
MVMFLVSVMTLVKRKKIMTVRLSNINFTHINKRMGIKSKNSQYLLIASQAICNDDSTEHISLYLCVFSVR